MTSPRVDALEKAFGNRIPADYLEFLSTHRCVDLPGVSIGTDDDRRDVRCLFELADGHPDNQLDRVFSLVGDVLPEGSLPIGEDWGGNFYCLLCSGPYTGRVAWWNHERLSGDDHVDLIVDSLDAFISGLVAAPDED